MVDRCTSDDELQAWIAGELDHAAEVRLEGHVAECSTCASKLQEIASLDELMRAAAAAIAPPRRRLLGGGAAFPGAFAVAAALVLGLRLPTPWELGDATTERGRAAVEICAEPEAATCTSPGEPSVPDDALATFPEDDEGPRGLCIGADDGAAQGHEPVCIDGEILAG